MGNFQRTRHLSWSFPKAKEENIKKETQGDNTNKDCGKTSGLKKSRHNVILGERAQRGKLTSSIQAIKDGVVMPESVKD